MTDRPSERLEDWTVKERLLAGGISGLAVGAILGLWAGAADVAQDSEAVIVAWLAAAGGVSGAGVAFLLPRLDSTSKQVALGGAIGAVAYSGAATVMASGLTFWAGVAGFVSGCVAAAAIRFAATQRVD